jgi:hypothetical protein
MGVTASTEMLAAKTALEEAVKKFGFSRSLAPLVSIS